jgi:hypothetical protein
LHSLDQDADEIYDMLHESEAVCKKRMAAPSKDELLLHEDDDEFEPVPGFSDDVLGEEAVVLDDAYLDPTEPHQWEEEGEEQEEFREEAELPEAGGPVTVMGANDFDGEQVATWEQAGHIQPLDAGLDLDAPFPEARRSPISSGEAPSSNASAWLASLADADDGD